MIFPVRCYTCNQLIANKWLNYCSIIEKNEEINSKKSNLDTKAFDYKSPQLIAFETLSIDNDCCRRHFLGAVELVGNDKI